MSLDLKETSITIRVPAYLKQQMTSDAREMGISMGEYIRAILFSDMLFGYSYSGKLKISKLRKAFEACDGVINSSQAQRIMGEPSDDNDKALDEIVKRGIHFLCADKVSVEHSTIDDLVTTAIQSAKKTVQREEVMEEAPAPEVVEAPKPEPAPEPVKENVEERKAPVQKPKRPKMGNTNAMI